MRRSACLAGAFVAGAGLLAGGIPAFADSADNDGINAGNDNNLSVAPIQLCGNNIAVIGAVVSILSPQGNQCVNAPIADHPEGKPPAQDDWEPPVQGETPPPVQGETPPVDDTPMPPGDGVVPPVQGETPPPVQSTTPPSNSDLPTAPSPAPVLGHHAVTG
ncbi:hypothetical protein ABT337_23295 [Saccharopolyspora hirsuta]|uniref:DUF320 domain-containing protein n=1 Tax=Saccharopolyspora hirsuta TaxID=1837 RepID=A0A5M7C6J0_SACHI|nr:hypothetical protein F1721_06805 [Saccharopolyspora hirsuta]